MLCQSVRVKVLFEDRALLVVDKPAGIASTGRRPDDEDAAQGILQREHGPLWAPHQLDKWTSGVLVFCKKKSAVREVNRLFAARKIVKLYLALVVGHLERPTTCDLALEDKPAFTRFSPHSPSSVSEWSFVQARPRTGRTHQVRRHLAALGLPIVSDAQYGVLDERTRLGLHAAGLELTSEQLGAHAFTSPLPADLRRFNKDA